MRQDRAPGVGILFVVMALTAGLWAGRLRIWWEQWHDGRRVRYSVAQLLLLRGGADAGRHLEVLLAQNGPHTIFSPNSWVFPSGAAKPSGGGQGAARAAAVTALAQQTGIKVDAPAV